MADGVRIYFCTSIFYNSFKKSNLGTQSQTDTSEENPKYMFPRCCTPLQGDSGLVNFTSHCSCVPRGPPKGIEVRDFNRFLSGLIIFQLISSKHIKFYMGIKPE